MRFILVTVNTALTEIHPDKEFPSMDDLKEWVLSEGLEWTSLVVTVLPAMNWKSLPIPLDDTERDAFKGILRLVDDKGEYLGGVCWFYDGGPFYSSVKDINDPSLVRRIGPCTTLEGAKQSVIDALEGRLDVSDRAAHRLSLE
jgi:hypothetical protein